MKCLITGVGGFVGSSLCERLLAEGHSVTGIDCFVPYYPKERKLQNLEVSKQYQSFDLIEQDLVACNLDGLLDGVEVVFHQAAQAGVRASWGDYFGSYIHNNILATQRLLEAAKGTKSLRKLVYASSSSIYGDAETFPTSESVIPRPVSPYGVTKLAAEHLVSLYASAYGVPGVSLRYFTVYGPRQRPDMAFNIFGRAALKGEPLVIYGDGEQTRDFTYISDIVEANLLAAEHGQAGQVFNIGGGAVISVNQVIEILRGYLPGLKLQRIERQAGDARHTSADISQASQLLSYTPKVQVAEGLRLELDWLESCIAA